MERRVFILALVCSLQVAAAKENPIRGKRISIRCRNINELRSVVGYPPDTAFVAGYRQSDDGGGGTFTWAPTSVTPDNGGTIIAGPGVVGRWIRAPGTAIPEWFGARGDGRSDDTAPLQALLLSARQVEFSRNRIYAISTLKIAPETTLRGNGATLLQRQQTAKEGQPMLRLTGGGICISDVRFDGQRSLQPRDGFSDSFDTGAKGTGRAFRAGILADGTEQSIVGVQISDCKFTEMYGACIALREVNQIVVDRNLAMTTNFELLHVTGAKMSSSIRVTNNVCRQIGTGDQMVQANGMVLSNVMDVVFEKNVFSNVERNALKLEQTSRNVVIRDNSLDRNSSDNFAFVQVQSLGTNYAENLTINNNRANDVGAGFAFNTVRLSNVLLENNEIVRTTGSSLGNGVQLGDGDIHEVTIRGNTLRGIRRYGVVVAQSLKVSQIDSIQILNNEISRDVRGCGDKAAILIGVFGGNEIALVKNIKISDNRIDPDSIEECRGACIHLWRKGIGRAKATRIMIGNNSCLSRHSLDDVVISPDFKLYESHVTNID